MTCHFRRDRSREIEGVVRAKPGAFRCAVAAGRAESAYTDGAQFNKDIFSSDRMPQARATCLSGGCASDSKGALRSHLLPLCQGSRTRRSASVYERNNPTATTMLLDETVLALIRFLALPICLQPLLWIRGRQRAKAVAHPSLPLSFQGIQGIMVIDLCQRGMVVICGRRTI